MPYLLPVLNFSRDEEYKLLGSGDADEDRVVLFKPHEWRGGNGRGPFEQTATRMADALNALPKGSVRAIYTTSDGGLNLTLVYEMVKQLASHVRVVDTETLTAMALQRGDSRQ